MKKVLILALGLSLTAASCNLLGSSGPRGILKSEDGGETYTPSNVLVKKGDISGLKINELTFDPNDPSTLFVGSANGIHKSTDSAKTWTFILAKMRIGDIAIDPSSTDILYASGVSGENGKIIKTKDGGQTFQEIYSEPTKNNPVLSLAISKANSKVLLAGLGNGEIIRSVDEGATWQLVRDVTNPVIKLEYTENTIAYALTLNGGLYKTIDQGSNWTVVDVALTADPEAKFKPALLKRYYDIAFDQKLPGVIFLATEQGLLRSIDGGVSWAIMSLPVTNETLKVSAVSVNPTNSNNILIAIGSTIFKTNNGGITWETKKLATEQKVMRIVINPDEPNIIYLGMGER